MIPSLVLEGAFPGAQELSALLWLELFSAFSWMLDTLQLSCSIWYLSGLPLKLKLISTEETCGEI